MKSTTHGTHDKRMSQRSDRRTRETYLFIVFFDFLRLYAVSFGRKLKPEDAVDVASRPGARGRTLKPSGTYLGRKPKVADGRSDREKERSTLRNSRPKGELFFSKSLPQGM